MEIMTERMPRGIFKLLAKKIGCKTSYAARQRFYRHDPKAIRAMAELRIEQKKDLTNALKELSRANGIDPYKDAMEAN